MKKENSIFGGIKIIDLGLWLVRHKCLILADLHIGYDFSLAEKGFVIPQKQLSETISRIEFILKELGQTPKTIVINGDFKHDFGYTPYKLKQEFEKIINYLANNCEKIILIKGNHDTFIPIKNKKLEVTKNLLLGEFLICHGDDLDNLPNSLLNKAKVIIIGHVHSVFELTDGIRSEKVKCFIKTKWKTKTLLIQPAFNVLIDELGGSSFENSFRKIDLKGEVWAIPQIGQILYFGKQPKMTLNLQSQF